MIRKGRLKVIGPDGKTAEFGPGGEGYAAEVRIAEEAVYRRICLDPELALGEGYMDGTIGIATDQLEPLLRLLVSNRGNADNRQSYTPVARALGGLRFALRRWAMRNTPLSARRNVAHHYDLSTIFTVSSSTRTGNTAAPISPGRT